MNRIAIAGLVAALTACAGHQDDTELHDDDLLADVATDNERALLDRIEVAKAAPGTKLLVVQKGSDEVANGRGSVYEVPDPTLRCDADCDVETQEYPTGTVVTLVAEAEAGSAFVGWSGACIGTASTCTVTMSSTRAVVANFRGKAALRAQPLGANGKIKSRDGRIDCAPGCNAQYDYGAEVELTVEFPAGVVFAGWEGACIGAGTGPTCRIVLNQDTDVAAQFRNVVTVAMVGTGAGSTVSQTNNANDGQINCGNDCVGHYNTGERVSIVAMPGADTIFGGWNACPNPQGNVCVIDVAGPVLVQPWLRKLEKQTVDVWPAGSGSVQVSFNGTSQTCSGYCEYMVPHGAAFNVRAVPGANTWFDWWAGPCHNRPDDCTFEPDGQYHYRAHFQNRFRLKINGDYRPISYRPTNGTWKSCANCTVDYNAATTVELSTPVEDDINCRLFSHWEGDCSGTSRRCVVRTDRPREARAVWVDWLGCVPR